MSPLCSSSSSPRPSPAAGPPSRHLRRPSLVPRSSVGLLPPVSQDAPAEAARPAGPDLSVRTSLTTAAGLHTSHHAAPPGQKVTTSNGRSTGQGYTRPPCPVSSLLCGLFLFAFRLFRNRLSRFFPPVPFLSPQTGFIKMTVSAA